MNNPHGDTKHPIAIARAKVRKRLHTVAGRKFGPPDLGLELSRTGLLILLLTGGIIGFGGIVCLIGGLIRSGPLAFLKGWLTALLGS